MWRAMLIRCTDQAFKEKNPSYLNVDLDPKWLDYCEFYDWYSQQNKEDDWQLDKDILVKGNQIYSESTCCVVPRCINNLFISRKLDRGPYPIGVTIRNDTGRYQSGGGIKYLGVYDSIEEAFNVYKKWKESRIKTLADAYKSQIRSDVYHALINYKVDITD